MPATATGRGAQVVVDPGSDTERAIRGSYANTLEDNLAKVRGDVLAGTFAPGNTTSDGTTNTGGKATDGATVPGGTGLARLLNPPVASVGNGADLTEDLLQTVTIPANALRNVGDILRIRAGGTFTGSTDTKVARVKLNGAAYASASALTAIAVSWAVHLEVQKSAAGTQISAGTGWAHQGLTNVASVNGNLTDTAAITLTVTGQNSTNSVAGSVLCRYLTVEVVPAPV